MILSIVGCLSFNICWVIILNLLINSSLWSSLSLFRNFWFLFLLDWQLCCLFWCDIFSNRFNDFFLFFSFFKCHFALLVFNRSLNLFGLLLDCLYGFNSLFACQLYFLNSSLKGLWFYFFRILLFLFLSFCLCLFLFLLGLFIFVWFWACFWLSGTLFFLGLFLFNGGYFIFGRFESNVHLFGFLHQSFLSCFLLLIVLLRLLAFNLYLSLSLFFFLLFSLWIGPFRLFILDWLFFVVFDLIFCKGQD